jgi:DNA adenine methylase
MLKLLPSPLRYPGGKNRAIPQILPLVPEHGEYREPMVGGGSLFLTLRQLYPGRRYWINDLNTDIYYLWRSIRDHPAEMMKLVMDLKSRYESPHDLFSYLKHNLHDGSPVERATRYFVLNRIGFSGLVDVGGTFSEYAYQKLFSASVIRRIQQLSPLLQGVEITNLDYSELLMQEGENVFIFLDPPYVTAGGYLYGRGGKLHEMFDHHRFAEFCKQCQHRWLITYDDCELVRGLFSGYQQVPWRLQYGMNNVGGNSARPGDELFIANYDIVRLAPKQLTLEI